MKHKATAAIAVTALLFLSACIENIENRTVPSTANTAKSGYHYQSAEEQRLQDDNFANPGYLWVDEGKTLFNQTENGPACASCHGADIERTVADQSGAPLHDQNNWQNAATRYPAYDPTLNRTITLEQRINQCRTKHQQRRPLPWESRELLALTAFVAHQAKGQLIQINRTTENSQSLDRGAAYFHQRKGQLNLACRHCHEQNPGRMLRGDRLSEGLPTGYPAYKLEWQTLGSLQRRLRDCDIGVRAEPYDYGAQIYTDLTLYLKLRAKGLEIDAPAVRR